MHFNRPGHQAKNLSKPSGNFPFLKPFTPEIKKLGRLGGLSPPNPPPKKKKIYKTVLKQTKLLRMCERKTN